MNNEKANSAMHFFLYLLHFFALSFVAFGFGGIVFQIINKFLPEASTYAYQGVFEQGAVKFGIAAIFVAGPVFFFSAKMIAKYLFEGKIEQDSRVRKWLIYIILFIAAATIIGDLIALIINFLEGDIASRFLLKVLTILLIAGSIFGYYFWDIRREKIKGKEFRENVIAFWSSALVIFVVFFSGFFIIDSPKISREKKMDIQTINDIQSVNSSIVGYYNQTGKLPENIGQLKSTNFFPSISKEDSVEYVKTGDKNFQLCAHFSYSNLDQKDRYYSDPYSSEWLHGQGRVCFDRLAVEQWEKGIEKPLPAGI